MQLIWIYSKNDPQYQTCLIKSLVFLSVIAELLDNNRRHLLSKFPMKPEQCFSLLIHRHFSFDTPSRLNTNVKRFGPHGNRRRVLFCFFPTHMNSSSFLLANSLPYNCSVFFTTHQQNYCYVNEQFTISSGHFYLSLRGL